MLFTVQNEQFAVNTGHEFITLLGLDNPPNSIEPKHLLFCVKNAKAALNASATTRPIRLLADRVEVDTIDQNGKIVATSTIAPIKEKDVKARLSELERLANIARKNKTNILFK